MVKMPGLEDELRALFERFVQDLLVTLNRAEWPVSELILSVLTKYLIQQLINPFTAQSSAAACLTAASGTLQSTQQANTQNEIAIKTAALDLLSMSVIALLVHHFRA